VPSFQLPGFAAMSATGLTACMNFLGKAKFGELIKLKVTKNVILCHFFVHF
jgi:hypothetical protein